MLLNALALTRGLPVGDRAMTLGASGTQGGGVRREVGKEQCRGSIIRVGAGGGEDYGARTARTVSTWQVFLGLPVGVGLWHLGRQVLYGR